LIEQAELLEDVHTAERQLAAGQGIDHEEAKAEALRRLRR
jgi:hypothetical protein